MANTNTTHFYLRTPERRPIGVVALRLQDDGEVRVAMSLCHPNDQWDPNVGIEAARARLSSERKGRALTLPSHKKVPLLLNVAIELKPHGTKAKDQSVGVDWPVAQEIFERQIEHLTAHNTSA